MTVRELCERLELAVLAGDGGLEREVRGCYAGDLLSWVMSHAGAGDAWLTVMGNANAVAVAKLVGIPCIVLCEGAELDAVAKAKADEHGIPVLDGGQNACRLALLVTGMMEG